MMIEQAASSTPITPPPVSAGPMLALGLALAGFMTRLQRARVDHVQARRAPGAGF